MKILKTIAAFILLAMTSVGAAFAQENRGSRPERGGFERFAPRTLREMTALTGFNQNNFAPDAIGTLDLTFGIGGKTTTVLPDPDRPLSMRLQPDGKILVVGGATTSNGSFLNTYIARYNANGALDAGFADGGVLRLANFADSGIYDAAVAPDGKIYVSGDKFNAARGRYDLAAYRLNADGTRDQTFGASGIAVAAVSEDQNYQAFGAVLQPDGKFVIVGVTRRVGLTTFDVGIARFNADGTLDPAFGTGGKQIVQIPNQASFSQVREAVLQPDGKIVLFGDGSLGSLLVEKVFLVRLNVNGTLDAAFGTNGIRLSDFNPGGRGEASDLAVQADGKILVSAFNYFGASGNFIGSTLARYNPNGTNDTTFGTDGAVFTSISSTGENFGASVLALPNGKIIQGGTVFNADFSQSRFALRRLNADGTRDTTFGSDGIVSVAWGVSNFGYETVLQPDGKIVSVGIFRNSAGEPFDLGLARFLPDAPAPPPFFDFDGDGRADISVYRGGVWYRVNSSDDSFNGTQWGVASDKFVPADYDGDRRSDLAVFRDGVWYVLNSQNNSFRAVPFGQAGDVPLPGDYDGDGRADVAVFRNGVWYVQNSSNNAFRAEQFGQAGDKPISGDFDADGRQDLAVFRGGAWYVNRSTAGFFAAQFGLASDKPVAADYDGDGRADLAVFRDGVWYISNSSNGQFRAAPFGIASDRPAPADYDGDGRADLAVFRGGNWFISNSTNNAFRAVQFGASGDAPVEAAYQP